MAAFLAMWLWLGAWLARGPTAAWLALCLWLFVGGWIVQFVGHYFAGRKPVFVDDLSGLLLGPLSVAAELGFLLGLRQPLRQAIEARIGPVRLREARAWA